MFHLIIMLWAAIAIGTQEYHTLNTFGWNMFFHCSGQEDNLLLILISTTSSLIFLTLKLIWSIHLLQVGKLADLVIWKPAFFGAKPEIVIKGGDIAWANMGDPNASIPTPEPVSDHLVIHLFQYLTKLLEVSSF